MSNTAVSQITPAPAGTVLAASAPDRGPGEPPEALVRIAAAVGGWSRKGARKRVRRVWPQVQADLDELYRAHEEERQLGAYLDYLEQRKGDGAGGADDTIEF